MRIMTDSAVEDKHAPTELLESLRLLIDEAVKDGTAVHELEQRLFKSQLSRGMDCLASSLIAKVTVMSASGWKWNRV